MRKTYVGRGVRAACFVCHGDEAHWHAKNAQGVAARHHDATGHPVWVEISMWVEYGDSPTRKALNRSGTKGVIDDGDEITD